MANSNVGVTPGTGKNVATYSFTEDASVKEVQRIVFNNSSGAEIKQDPLASYKIADTDGAATPNTIYLGFTTNINVNTNWIIWKQVSGTSGNAPVTFRYANVSNNTNIAYGTATTGAWATRATLTYDYLYNLTGV